MSTEEALQAIKKQLAKQKNEEVEEINLSDIKFKKFDEKLSNQLEKFENLNILFLNNCNLSSFENFPKLNALQRLELERNQITGEMLKQFPEMEQLSSLSLSSNKIQQIDEIRILADKLPNLAEIELEGHITEQPNFKDEMFKIFPQLMILNNVDVDGNELEELIEDEEDIILDEDGNPILPLEEEEENGSQESDQEEDNKDKEADDNDFDFDDEDQEEVAESKPQKKVKKN